MKSIFTKFITGPLAAVAMASICFISVSAFANSDTNANIKADLLDRSEGIAAIAKIPTADSSSQTDIATVVYQTTSIEQRAKLIQDLTQHFSNTTKFFGLRVSGNTVVIQYQN